MVGQHGTELGTAQSSKHSLCHNRRRGLIPKIYPTQLWNAHLQAIPPPLCRWALMGDGWA